MENEATETMQGALDRAPKRKGGRARARPCKRRRRKDPTDAMDSDSEEREEREEREELEDEREGPEERQGTETPSEAPNARKGGIRVLFASESIAEEKGGRRRGFLSQLRTLSESRTDKYKGSPSSSSSSIGRDKGKEKEKESEGSKEKEEEGGQKGGPREKGSNESTKRRMQTVTLEGETDTEDGAEETTKGDKRRVIEGTFPSKSKERERHKGSKSSRIVRNIRDRIRFSGDESIKIAVLQSSSPNSVSTCIGADEEGRIVKLQCYISNTALRVGGVYSIVGCRCKYDETDGMWKAVAHRDFGSTVQRIDQSKNIPGQDSPRVVDEKRTEYDPYLSYREALKLLTEGDSEKVSVFGILCEDPFITQIGVKRKWLLRLLDRSLYYFRIHWDEIDGRIVSGLRKGMGIGFIGLKIIVWKESESLCCDHRSLIVPGIPCDPLLKRIEEGDVPLGRIVAEDIDGMPIDERMITDPYHLDRAEVLLAQNYKEGRYYVNDIRCRLRVSHPIDKDSVCVDIIRPEREIRPVIMSLQMRRTAIALPPDVDFEDPQSLDERLRGREYAITILLHYTPIAELGGKKKIKRYLHVVKEC